MIFKKAYRQEDEWLAKARQGDQRSIKQLVSHYSSFAYTIAFGVVGNHEEAEEIVQDAFLKAFNALSGFKQSSRFSTWLYKIVYRTALNKLQAIGREQRKESLNDTLYEIADNTQAWDSIQKSEREKYVQQALNQLQATDKLLVQLHYIAEKSIAEICEITGHKRSAVKMRLLRSRKQLEQALKTMLNKEISELL
ncbi:RNA polymerase sigma-70 factor, ECF subfamily [Chitinophaga terrae (ex Kim and Jung 2007)]|uniref:RNA polymerase sigma factor n=1 Tax=Chitinophaga terrae (ex Kim and Jung 2007) TaxID=408074 RepID=A0A1H4BK00_9BACT|nr:sigma-70 family RNA polymerase sigma factor [Chitinophaga terrae (ex Kim and Jung 2007)]GEP89607.1 DNA-directed RNA polymerase sigma-70 factor [Chitinophaga terrae (ex Kim and Jung 2007)]SEA48426.1 RNA polymerase sigma-70 factor, ECF subfamily [Chitinophaga terrae (ex Kim and Jung 2007)]